ncbi:peptidase S26B, signal peptidase [groundwater metagenome]
MPLLEKIRKFYRSDSFWAGLFRDVLFVIAVVAVFASVSRVALGLWTPMVAVESGSMIPHIQIGDIIFMESIDRTGIVTYRDGEQSGYSSFDNYGDVILYRPFGRDGVTPIIHRAMYYVEEGESLWDGGPPAPHAGYITKGDNSKTNPSFDQQGSISYLQPVKKEWVIGVARFGRVPVLGCISLIPRGNFACLKG